MRDIVGESVAGGAVGYSTSRILVHTVPDGRKVPGTYASAAEHLAFADGMNDAGGGIFQAVNDFESPRRRRVRAAARDGRARRRRAVRDRARATTRAVTAPSSTCGAASSTTPAPTPGTSPRTR